MKESLLTVIIALAVGYAVYKIITFVSDQKEKNNKEEK
jgi:hypothetical protein